MSFHYAQFNDAGACIGITSSSYDLCWPHPVPAGTCPDLIYFNGGEIKARQYAEVSVDRAYYLSDGIDGPTIAGARVTSAEPQTRTLEMTGQYRSDPISVRFDTVEALHNEFCAQIDREAGVERLAHITVAHGQAEVYAAKLAEARAFIGGGSGPFLYVITTEQAENIIARADQCNAALAGIEARRLAAKAAIRAAENVTDMMEALAW